MAKHWTNNLAIWLHRQMPWFYLQQKQMQQNWIEQSIKFTLFSVRKNDDQRSPGLMVMGGVSCSEGRGFESRRLILDGHSIFPHIFVVRIVVFVWKDENKWKRGRGWPIFVKKQLNCNPNDDLLDTIQVESLEQRMSVLAKLTTPRSYPEHWPQ